MPHYGIRALNPFAHHGAIATNDPTARKISPVADSRMVDSEPAQMNRLPDISVPLRTHPSDSSSAVAACLEDMTPSHVATVTTTPKYTIKTVSPISSSPTSARCLRSRSSVESASARSHTTITTKYSEYSETLLDYAVALNTPCSHGLYASNFPYHVIKCWVTAEVIAGRLDAEDYWKMCRCVDDVLDAELEAEEDVQVEHLNGGRLVSTRNSLDIERNQRCYGCRGRRRRRRLARMFDVLLRPWRKWARKHGGTMIN